MMNNKIAGNIEFSMYSEKDKQETLEVSDLRVLKSKESLKIKMITGPEVLYQRFSLFHWRWSPGMSTIHKRNGKRFFRHAGGQSRVMYCKRYHNESYNWGLCK